MLYLFLSHIFVNRGHQSSLGSRCLFSPPPVFFSKTWKSLETALGVLGLQTGLNGHVRIAVPN